MAKRRMTGNDSPLRRTVSQPVDDATPTVPAEGYTRTVGVSLKESEIALLGEIAQRLGVSRNKLTRWVIRYGLGAIAAGRVDLSAYVTESRRADLDMP